MSLLLSAQTVCVKHRLPDMLGSGQPGIKSTFGLHDLVQRITAISRCCGICQDQ